jgi:uncharacterized protein (TIGR00297 family)
MNPSTQLIAGFVLALLVGVAAWRARTLAVSGMLAAILTGGLIFGLGGLPWATLLLAFFISSSLLSKLFRGKKQTLAAEKFAKGSQRDWGQVLANDGMGAFLVMMHVLYPDHIWPWLAYGGAMATVNGDTWATELGILSKNLPRLITSWKPVERGTSGGITLTGSLATLAGAGLIALFMLLTVPSPTPWQVLMVISTAGLAGAFFDSLLGATVQAIFYDPIKGKETERKILDQDGNPTAPIRGWRWMNNDAVNFISSIVGALVATGLWALLS